ncbi:CHAT domain-containing tetratricopeptide repeat protein [Aquimarina sp. MMG016]|uniref:CHAT domain-containing protein n=1 Tax=Aquimarina sp. MMG016 TaxID=2822690 RepID=UPI001B3A35F0|nr:CHAT domain-containing tetratricopeptide repeat protein [Aquimarina sp. MMG016]MBQ4820659.1 CHAT domain-containing protein [Aquimarina sp. MMG016]
MTKQRSLPHQILFLILICSVFWLNAQTKKDTLQAYKYFTEGDTLLKQREYKKSIVLFEKAAMVYADQRVWKKQAQSLNKVARSYYMLKDFDNTILFSNRVLDIGEEKLSSETLEKAYALIRMGEAYGEKNQYKEALKNYTKALPIIKKIKGKDNIQTAVLYNYIAMDYDNIDLVDKAELYYDLAIEINQKLYDKGENNELSTPYLNLAILYSRSGLFKHAIPYYKKTIQLDIETFGEKHPYVADSYYNFGNNYSYIGEDDLALQYYQKALNIFNEALEEGDESFALVYDGIGTQYTKLGKTDQALKNYTKALKIYQNIYGDENLYTANVIANIGGTYRTQKQYNISFSYLTKAHKLIRKIVGEYSREMLFPNDELGQLFERKGEYQKANEFYQKNLDIALKNFGLKNQRTAECYINKARIYLANQKYSDAIQEYHNAIVSGTEKFKDVSLDAFPEPTDYFNSSTLLTAIYGKAKSLKIKGEKLNNTPDLLLSRKNLALCDSLIDQTRNSYVSIKDKTSLEKIAADVYNDAISLSIMLYNQLDDKEYLNDAFYFSEKNKARLLDEQLRKTKAERFADIPEEKLKTLYDTRSKLALYSSKLQEYNISKEAEDSAKLSPYFDLVFSYSRKKDSLLKEIEKEYPKYHLLKYDNSIILVTKIQNKISENTSLVEYFITDTKMYVFSISKNSFSVEEIKIDKLDEKIIKFREAIVVKDIETYKKLGYELYTALINPITVPGNNENLIIVPDGALWHLNFDLLLTAQSSQDVSSGDLPYFLRKKVISYANSADLYFRDNINNDNILNECLAFSFSDVDAVSENKEITLNTLRSSKSDLPGAREEIKAISSIVEGTYFYGDTAIESNFKKNANRYTFLHLAVHGELDDKNPENSKLYFTQVQDSIQDNYLYNQEIYNLSIPAELAVLSACNTGAGKISKGEGVMSLGRAFQYAGTKSLVLTNWEVSDETTPQLMKNFYTNLKKGMNKAKALQQAKLDFLAKANVYQTDPFYWGGFYLIGDTGTLDLDQNDWNWYMVLIFISGIVFFGFLYYRFKGYKR